MRRCYYGNGRDDDETDRSYMVEHVSRNQRYEVSKYYNTSCHKFLAHSSFPLAKVHDGAREP